ncbi:MAG TPA: hypothetical protein VKH64_07705 [Candidatus Binatia bacterium]|nr:hypothetical protein [Candidatus Binatia bacterium]
MRYLAKLIAIAALVIFSACAPAVAPETTRAKPKTQEDVMAMIQVMEPAIDKSCGERELKRTEVVKRATAEDYTAVERWIIDRCGKEVSYLVTFRPSTAGGVDFSVQLEK